jgi:predicted PurR-regulated permease PerM
MSSGPQKQRSAVEAAARRPGSADVDGPDATQAEIVAAAEAEAEELSGEGPVLGTPGPPMNRRSPFMIGLLGAAGVAVTYGIVHLIVVAASILALIGLSLFLAVGLEPAVTWLMRFRLPRAVAVVIVALVVVGVVVGFLFAAIPPLVSQVATFVKDIPNYFAQMRDHSTTLGRLDARFHIQNQITQLTSAKGTALASGLLHFGTYVLSATVSTLTALILTVYLLVDLPRIRRMIYRMVPASRRPRVILIGDEVSVKVGAYVLGNLATSLIAGAGTLVWLLIFHVPYPFVLSIMVALLDLIPVIGSTVAGAIVTLVALTVSFPVALATLAFYIAYRLLEDYLIVPRIMGRAVEVPATATIIAVLIGGAALGLLGALVAIPAAAAIDVILRETVYPRLDRA